MNCKKCGRAIARELCICPYCGSDLLTNDNVSKTNEFWEDARSRNKIFNQQEQRKVKLKASRRFGTILLIAAVVVIVLVGSALGTTAHKNAMARREKNLGELLENLPGCSFSAPYYERYGVIMTGTRNHYITIAFKSDGTLDCYLSTKRAEQGDLYGTFNYTVTYSGGSYKVFLSTQRMTVHGFKLIVDSNNVPQSIECIPTEGNDWSQ